MHLLLGGSGDVVSRFIMKRKRKLIYVLWGFGEGVRVRGLSKYVHVTTLVIPVITLLIKSP